MHSFKERRAPCGARAVFMTQKPCPFMSGACSAAGGALPLHPTKGRKAFGNQESGSDFAGDVVGESLKNRPCARVNVVAAMRAGLRLAVRQLVDGSEMLTPIEGKAHLLLNRHNMIEGCRIVRQPFEKLADEKSLHLAIFFALFIYDLEQSYRIPIIVSII